MESALRARSEAVNSVAIASDATGVAAPPQSAAESQSAYAKQLAEVPELASYGSVLKSSSKPVELTESETEYVVTCVKHIFAEHIVFQVSRPELEPLPPRARLLTLVGL